PPRSPLPVVHQLAAPPPPPAPIALEVVSHPPGAHVSVGDQRVGTTPFTWFLPEGGNFKVSVERPGFERRELTTGPLEPGDHRTLDVELHPLTKKRRAPSRPSGTLTVRTVPWSKVYDGARLLGTTPLANVALSAGSH